MTGMKDRTYLQDKAITLIEILIAMTLFGMFLTAVSICVVEGYKAYSKGTKSSHLFRGVAIGMEQMTRILHTCERIYVPDSSSLIQEPEWFIPRTGTPTPVFVFVRTNPATAQREVNAYQWNDNTNEVIHWLYDPGFDPGVPGTQTIVPNSTKVLAKSIQDLSFQLSSISSNSSVVGEIITIRFTSHPDKGYFPLLTNVQIKDSGY